MTGPRRARHRSGPSGSVFGAMLFTGGLLWLLNETGLVELPLRVIGSAVLLVLGLGLFASSWRGRTRGALIFIGILLTLALAGSHGDQIGVSSAVGRTVVSPVGAGPHVIDHGVGDITVDLSGLDYTTPQTVTIEVAFGDLTILVPDGVDVTLKSEELIGDVLVFGTKRASGFDRKFRYTTVTPGAASDRHVEVSFAILLSDIEVRRAAD